MRKLLLGAAGAVLLVGATGAGTIAVSSYRTEAAIDAHAGRIAALAHSRPSPAWDPSAIAELPPPVQAYFRFAFPEPPPRVAAVRLAMAGEFRRPLTESFHPTTAEQTIAAGDPALVFSATTRVAPLLWARAWDAFADGRMEMKARVLSTITVMDESETEALNGTSLRRWLLESPLYPMALLPGGPVRWEPVDERRARAVVSAGGLEASLVATFAEDGALLRFDAETEGDLDTPYHGSGEHAARSDYRLVAGVRVPFAFTIARAADGRTYPFWRGRITEIAFESARPN